MSYNGETHVVYRRLADDEVDDVVAVPDELDDPVPGRGLDVLAVDGQDVVARQQLVHRRAARSHKSRQR